jgi:hypothetical protein
MNVREPTPLELATSRELFAELNRRFTTVVLVVETPMKSGTDVMVNVFYMSAKVKQTAGMLETAIGVMKEDG